MVIVDALIAFANWFWGIPLLLLCGVGGIVIGVYCGFPWFKHFGYVMSQTFGKMFSKSSGEGTVSAFAAACSALASAIGASNIVGVPVAIALGGPGAVFWIEIMAFIGMGTKFNEVVNAVAYRHQNDEGEYVGGPFYYLRQVGKEGSVLRKIGAICGSFFAFMLMIELIPSLAAQAASATQQGVAIGIPQIAIAIVVAAITAFTVIGGAKRVGEVCDKLVPIMAAFYLVGALIVIIKNAAMIPAAIGSIFRYAFTGHAAMGGFAGAAVSATLRWGLARGLYSNEAGFGTTCASHAGAVVDHPVRQGSWGVFEVFMDTTVVCTMTALVILTSGVWTEEGIETGALAQAAYNSVFGSFGLYFVALCVFLFVLSTMLACAFYGMKQAEFLFGVKFSRVWVWVYIAACIVGGMGIDLGVLYSLTDAFLGVIIIPNMIGLFLLLPKTKKLVNEYYNTPGKYYLADMAAKKGKK